jgi:Immunity protein 52
MLAEDYTVIAQWSYRPETLESASQRVGRLLDGLKEIDPIFSQWVDFKDVTGTGRREPLTMTADVIHKIMEAEVNRNSASTLNNDRYLFMAPNSLAPSNMAAIVVLCGRTDTSTMGNFVTIHLTQLADNNQILSIQNIKKLIQCIVTSMEPDWVSVRPSRLIFMKYNREKTHPEVGWVTYLAKQSQSSLVLPQPSYIEQWSDGILIIATDETLSQLNPAHVRLTETIDETLIKAGIFAPDKPIIAPNGVEGASRIIRIINRNPHQIDCYLEPTGMRYPMLSQAEFKIVVSGDREIDIELHEKGFSIYGSPDIFYGNFKLEE